MCCTHLNHQLYILFAEMIGSQIDHPKAIVTCRREQIFNPVYDCICIEYPSPGSGLDVLYLNVTNCIQRCV